MLINHSAFFEKARVGLQNTKCPLRMFLRADEEMEEMGIRNHFTGISVCKRQEPTFLNLASDVY
jgi:hypothetical protein